MSRNTKILNIDDLDAIIKGKQYPKVTTAEMYAIDTQDKVYDGTIYEPQIVFNTDLGEYCYYRGKWITFSGNEVVVYLIDESFNLGSLPAGFTLINDTVNTWVVGSATANSGTNSIYISNDGGITNAYSNKTPDNISHFAIAYTLPVAAKSLIIDFDWKCFAEPTYDFMNVNIMSSIAGVSAGSLITIADPNLLNQIRTNNQTGVTEFSGNFEYKNNKSQLASSSLIATGTYYLVYSFTNDFSVVNNPPAAIDNIKIGYIPA